MKIVGHSTVIMTLYYTKLGVATIREVMTEAAFKFMASEQVNWAMHQKSLELKALTNEMAFTSEDGLVAFARASTASIVFMDTGICPVGCAKCDIGGPALTEARKARKHTPVPGGRRNCASCRFFISGPPFLIGLTSVWNGKSLEANGLARRRRELEIKVETLEAERAAAYTAGEPFSANRELDIVSTQFDEKTSELDQVLLEMNALARIIAQSQMLLSEERDNSKLALVAIDQDSVQVSFEESHEFELVDRICQDSVFFTAINPGVANLKRARAYDKMLLANGLRPAFLDLDEEASMKVGNEFSKLLRKRVGREGTIKLIQGSTSLSALGLSSREFDSALQKVTGNTISISRAEGARTLQSEVAAKIGILHG